MIKYSFDFCIRLDCEDYPGEPAQAGLDYDTAVATAQAALVPLWNHKQRIPINYASDIAPRIHLVVASMGFDRPTDDPYACVEWLVTVTSDDLNLLRDLRRWACDNWDEDGDLGADHPISQAIQETDEDLAPSRYATCAACGFSTDRCVEPTPGRFLCVPCDDHEEEEADNILGIGFGPVTR